MEVAKCWVDGYIVPDLGWAENVKYFVKMYKENEEYVKDFGICQHQDFSLQLLLFSV